MSQTQHPDELLAEYVEGTLGPDDRALVEAHLSACPGCREDVVLAGGARGALASLPEVEVPAGATRSVVERARRRRVLAGVPWTPRMAWAAAGVAAAAAVVVAGFVLFTPPTAELGQGAAQEEAGAPAGPAPAAEDAISSEEEFARAQAQGGYPLYRARGGQLDSASLREATLEVADEAELALEAGFPEPPARFYSVGTLSGLSRRAQEGFSCVTEAAAPGRALVPFVVEASTFEDEAAYVAYFLQADAPDRPYTELAVYVVSREDCTLRSFARQRL